MTIPPNPHPEQVEALTPIWSEVYSIGISAIREDWTAERYRAAILASLANCPADDGFALVPVKLTQEMHEAVVQLDWNSTHDPLWPEYWSALLAAAPQLGMANRHADDAVTQAYDQHMQEANKMHGEGVISYEVLKAIVNTAAAMRDAALTPANRPADDGEPSKARERLERFARNPYEWRTIYNLAVSPDPASSIAFDLIEVLALPPQPEGVKRP